MLKAFTYLVLSEFHSHNALTRVTIFSIVMVAPMRITFMLVPLRSSFIDDDILTFLLLQTRCSPSSLMLKDILLGPNNLESSYKHESYLQIYVIL